MKTLNLKKSISISIVTSILLSNQLLLANPNNIPKGSLPNGGKFVGNNGGTIISNGNTMTITGKGNGGNHVIAWGGGFNIGNGYQVNFEGSGTKGYLNLDYSKNPSKIAGVLNGNNHNIFLVNPSGVLVTETGSINANRFVASTTPVSIDDINTFSDPKTDSFTFSPVFKPSKAGDIINKGNINANKVLLIGNNVRIDGGKLGNENAKAHLVGNYIHLDRNINVSHLHNKKIDVTSKNATYLQNKMIDFANNNYIFLGDLNHLINVVNYQETNGELHYGSNTFKKAITLGNMGSAKENAIEWWYFANGWNNNKGETRNISEFKLVGDIDFGGKEGKNYTNYCLSNGECTSMIVGKDYENAFTAGFDGQGHTLKNINIKISEEATGDYKPLYAGVFGMIKDGNLKNINVDYKGGGLEVVNSTTGGFAGYVVNGTFTNITLKNIENINAVSNGANSRQVSVGGFAGYIKEGDFRNISLNDRGDIYVDNDREANIGGFAGYVANGTFSNIILNNAGEIRDYSFGNYLGGFAGSIKNGTFTNIALNGMDRIYVQAAGSGTLVYLGGFAGRIYNGTFSNIVLNNIGNISGSASGYGGSAYIGGFSGWILKGNFENIILNNNGIFYGNYTYYQGIGGFAGKIENGSFSNITMYLNGWIRGESAKLFAGSGNSNSLILNNINIYYTDNVGVSIIMGSSDSVTGITAENLHNETALNNKKEEFAGYENDKGRVYWDKELQKFVVLDKSFTSDNNGGDSGFSDLNNDGLNDVDLDELQDHFDSLVSSSNGESLLEQILNDILNGNYKLDLSMLDLANVDGIEDLKLLLKMSEDSPEYQSIKQSIEFLTSLYSDKDIKEVLQKWYGNKQEYKDFLAKGKDMQENADKLRKFISTYGESIKAIKGNADRLNSIIAQIYGKDGLMEAYKNLIQIGELEEAENTKRKILSLYKEALALQNGLETIKPIVDKLQVNIPFDLKLVNGDNGGTFTFLDSTNIKEGIANIPSIEEPKFDIEDNNTGSKEDPKINAPLKDINASMINKEKIVLVKPAEEEKEALDEEKGTLNSRTCVVSENFKTNNPCMAERI
ncbi:filamentous hemagglutinin N-terminal domain-containing protein [Helicobacter burdigaliensis]|uniref:two-partner secretion domain-containing protein n=1 Tax=Helicobacter burdigaliensis TaxID=2315334 RepID=UPI000EF6EB4E|nr:filamentous hemagglutinin N-terminal domain-containing protein [Helicobacter burdigaliensis]